MTGKNEFFKKLTQGNKGIVAARAAIITEDVESEQRSLIDTLKKEKRDLTRALNKLEDMGPDSELSLRVVKDNFSAASWVANYQSLQVSLKDKEEELSIAEETYNNWFGGSAVED